MIFLPWLLFTGPVVIFEEEDPPVRLASHVSKSKPQRTSRLARITQALVPGPPRPPRRAPRRGRKAEIQLKG